jgi:hypothetical protein
MASRVVTDTTEFHRIGYKDIIQVGDKQYSVIGDTKEMRFGIEDPKFWVKRVYDLDTKERKIIKLVFHESFVTTLAGIKITCFRSPTKEANILNLVTEHPCFMQGQAFNDEKGNNVRILDVVRGQNIFVFVDSLYMKHEEYFHNVLPSILTKIVKAFEAIMFLHNNGYRHGDIRNDHLIMERTTGNYVWIDFDYDFETSENPFSLDLFGMGNILLYVIGKGFHLYYAIVHDEQKYGDLAQRITKEDFSILEPSRFLNLKKLYPYIPKLLNDILMHFSEGADIYYESSYELIEDLKRCVYSIF